MDEDIRDANVMSMIVSVILYCIFCMYGFFLMFTSLREKICHQPYLTISDKGLVMNGILKKKYIDFTDVEYFDKIDQKLGLGKLIVTYNPEVSKKKLKDLNIILRLLRQSKFYQEQIDISFINMKVEELCNLLNERLSQNSSPIIEEEPQVQEDETVPVEETRLPETKEDSIDTEVRYASRLHAICYVFFSSIIIATLCGLISLGWREWGWFPKAKDYVPDFVVPVIMSAVHLFICRNFIRSLKGKAGEFAWYVAAILSFFLFMVAGFTGSLLVDRKTVNISDFHNITPEMESALAKADYLHVKNISTADLDTIRGNYYFDFSTYTGSRARERIEFHLYGVYPLCAIPNVYIVNETTESHDYTYASKEALDEMAENFIDKEAGFMLKEEMNDRYLKRLLPSDNIEGYQEAIREIYEKENKPFDSDKIIIYEFTNSEKSENVIFFLLVIIFAILLLEIILLLIGYRWFFDEEKYMEAVITSGWWKELKLNEFIVYSLPVLMTLIFILMLFNGYSMDTTNREMLMQWGALERSSVLEEHEWWRLLTYGFLHDGIMHLFGNLLLFVASVYMMTLTHNGYRITLVFLISILFAGIVILLFGSGFCVGASGGVFGLMSFWICYELYTAYVNKDHDTSPTVLFPLAMIVLLLLSSFGYGINMSGHLGGLVVGIILAIIIGAKDKSNGSSAI